MQIYKGKGDVMNCSAYRGVKLLEHEMKIIERILEDKDKSIGGGIQYAIWLYARKKDDRYSFYCIMRRMQEEYKEKDKKFYMCFMDLEKAFDRVPRRVMQWALRKKGLPEILVKAVMSLYEGLKTKVKVGSELSEEFYVAIGVHHGSICVCHLYCLQLWWML